MKDNDETRDQETRERLGKIFDFSNDAIFIIDPEGDEILDVNPSACRMLGYSREELLSLAVSAIHPDEMPQLRAFAKSVLEDGKGWTNELTCLTKGSQTLPAEISASIVDIRGKTCMIALVRDISQRKRAEEALVRLASFPEQNPNPVVETDLNGKVTYLNPLASERFPDLETAGLEHALFEGLRAIVSELKEGGAESIVREIEIGDCTYDQKVTHVSESGIVRIFAHDITKRKQAEQALQEANEKLERRVAERTAELSDALTEVEDLKNRLQAENVYLQEEIKLQHNFDEIISRSEALNSVLRKVEQVASTDATVLILGETGTGKELLARAVHNISARKDRPLVKVNCAALPANLIESELFGHEKGAFTGALAQKVGRFELADGGTAFLDEIGDLPLELQSKLLRVLQEGEFERLGDPRTVKVDARVIAATNRDLEKAIDTGDFREDLYYRLNVFPIVSPPLRDRKEDIPLLVNHFLMKFGAKMGKKIETIPQKEFDKLQAYHWPGNVRELENVIERAMITSPGTQLELGDWLPRTRASSGGSTVSTLEELEREHILRVLEQTGWRVSGEKGAAKILEIKPTTLQARMKKLGIKRKR